MHHYYIHIEIIRLTRTKSLLISLFNPLFRGLFLTVSHYFVCFQYYNTFNPKMRKVLLRFFAEWFCSPPIITTEIHEILLFIHWYRIV